MVDVTVSYLGRSRRERYRNARRERPESIENCIEDGPVMADCEHICQPQGEVIIPQMLPFGCQSSRDAQEAVDQAEEGDDLGRVSSQAVARERERKRIPTYP